ncbi:hypothetical protein T08_6155 [Trichinella sp. T8]|nr:hypothetical protein T08_6155 [Trichinella sp. T8]
MGKNCLGWVATIPLSLDSAGAGRKPDCYRRLFIHSRFSCCVVPTQDLLLPQASKCYTEERRCGSRPSVRVLDFVTVHRPSLDNRVSDYLKLSIRTGRSQLSVHFLVL